jgi:hypothetical protein
MGAVDRPPFNLYEWDRLTRSNADRYALELVEAGFDAYRYFVRIQVEGVFALEVKRGIFDRKYAIQIVPARSFGTIVAEDVVPRTRKRAVLALVLMVPGIPDFMFLLPEMLWPGHAPLLETRVNDAAPDGPPVRVLNLTPENLPMLTPFTFDQIARTL